jgi:hypothetical protein
MKPNVNKSVFFLSIGLCALLTFLLCFADSASAEFSKRVQITIHASQVAGGSPLIDFPVMIKLNGSQFQQIENDIGPNGYDIQFRASDETTPLTHEIETYDETNDLLTAWVKIPSLSNSSDTVIYMYYGDSSISSPTHNPQTPRWPGRVASRIQPATTTMEPTRGHEFGQPNRWSSR